MDLYINNSCKRASMSGRRVTRGQRQHTSPQATSGGDSSPTAANKKRKRASAAENGRLTVRSFEGLDWDCPVCLDLLCEPVCTSCGHDVCSFCYTTWATEYSNAGPAGVRCPMCRARIARETPGVSKRLESTIKQLFPVRYQQRVAETKQKKIDQEALRAEEEVAREEAHRRLLGRFRQIMQRVHTSLRTAAATAPGGRSGQEHASDLGQGAVTAADWFHPDLGGGSGQVGRGGWLRSSAVDTPELPDMSRYDIAARTINAVLAGRSNLPLSNGLPSVALEPALDSTPALAAAAAAGLTDGAVAVAGAAAAAAGLTLGSWAPDNVQALGASLTHEMFRRLLEQQLHRDHTGLAHGAAPLLPPMAPPPRSSLPVAEPAPGLAAGPSWLANSFPELSPELGAAVAELAAAADVAAGRFGPHGVEGFGGPMG